MFLLTKYVSGAFTSFVLVGLSSSSILNSSFLFSAHIIHFKIKNRIFSLKNPHLKKNVDATKILIYETISNTT